MTTLSSFNFCTACGKGPKQWIFKKIISDELAYTWKLSPELQKKFCLRESQFCPHCGNSARTRVLATAIMNTITLEGVTCLAEWVDKIRKMNISIAEINSCGNLHPILARLSGLVYSEFPSSKFSTRLYHTFRRIRKEDITNLSYPSKSFDIVLHSEVLEHVPDINKALLECQRILKPKGICLFTVPFIPNRKTKQCVKVNKETGKISYLKTPSYHGLDKRNDNMVWWEFGYDFLAKFNLQIVLSDPETMTYVFAMKNPVK